MGIKSSKNVSQGPLLRRRGNELRKLSKRIDGLEKRTDSEESDSIRDNLKEIRDELDTYKSILKEKHKEKYDKLYMNVQILLEKLLQTSGNHHQRSDNTVDNDSSVELRIVRLEPSFDRMSIRSDPPKSPKVRFGVQVFPSLQPEERPSSFSLKKTNTVPSIDYVEKQAFLHLERINETVDRIEQKLKFFHGRKGDQHYSTFHYKLVQNLLKVDAIESNENPVINQEKKIATERIQELLAILERLVQEDEDTDVPVKPMTVTPI